MTNSADYADPLQQAIGRMREQMAKPENVAKTHWLETPMEELWGSIERNLGALETLMLLEDTGFTDDGEEIFRRAANVANYAWMIAEKATAPRG